MKPEVKKGKLEILEKQKKKSLKYKILSFQGELMNWKIVLNNSHSKCRETEG